MELSKGIFWITEDKGKQYFFRIICTSYGDIVGATDYPLNSKDGTNYNHKMLWDMLPKSLTKDKSFNYFPRGRVEIRNSKARVFLNPDINIEEIQQLIIEYFGLIELNGIKSVRIVADGSNHYNYKIGNADD